MWADMVGNNMIGLFFIRGNYNNMAHLSERQRIEILMIYGYRNRKRTQSEVCTVFNGIFFQQDGAPPHFAVHVREYLNHIFFLWGHVKNSVFKQRPRNLEDLKVRITAEMRRIPAEMLVTQSYYS
ncbi:hypothetical protein NQ318_012982 [Aromia moschata]|uniref:Transposase n=1 Tax=Aromia moschata TaxID=1265417 RepID=A0AAV8XFA3_9CUCU|nr:hypothetical protein NQ318_012982 [Aromia moschata]